MMCHSVLLVRHLLTQPGAAPSSVRPVRITGHVASLKWSRPPYAAQLAATFGREVDYAKRPSEDFASVMIEFETADGQILIGEASTSWSFVGAGLRLSAELLGPEYSMSWNTLNSGLNLFFSREVRGATGEDLVEKQNAEVGSMPVVANEAAAYGYENEDRHFVRAFLGKEAPLADLRRRTRSGVAADGGYTKAPSSARRSTFRRPAWMRLCRRWRAVLGRQS